MSKTKSRTFTLDLRGNGKAELRAAMRADIREFLQRKYPGREITDADLDLVEGRMNA